MTHSFPPRRPSDLVRGPEIDCHVLGIEFEPAGKEGHRYCFLSSKPPPGWRTPLSLSLPLASPAPGPNLGEIPARPRAAGWTGRSGCAGGSRFESACARRAFMSIRRLPERSQEHESDLQSQM